MLDNDYLLKGQMYQYNLGWLIEQLLNFKQDLATAIDLKTIKYADPIQWDITTQYPANTVVVDSKSGTAYMSKVPVPAGVELTNTNYWVVVFNYQDIYNKIMDGIAFNDRDQDYATKDLLVNDLVWYAGDLYRTTREIPAGSKYIPGTNLIKTTIESLLARYYGRDRTAQVSNDTVNVSGDYTLVAGDIAETSTNRTIKVTKDREVDVDGSDSIHINGASTLNVGGLRTEVYAGDKTVGVYGNYTETFNNAKTSTFKGVNIINTKDMRLKYTNFHVTNSAGKEFNMNDVYTINMQLYGCDNTGVESITSLLLTAVQENATLLFPAGTYLIDSNVTLPGNVRMVGVGATFIFTANGCITLSNGENGYINNIIFDGRSMCTTGLIVDTRAAGVVIENCAFFNFTEVSIKIGNTVADGGHQWLINCKIYNPNTLATCIRVLHPDLRIISCELLYARRAIDLQANILFIAFSHIWSGGRLMDAYNDDVAIFANKFSQLILDTVYIDSYTTGILGNENLVVNAKNMYLYWDAERTYITSDVRGFVFKTWSKYNIDYIAAKSANVTIYPIWFEDIVDFIESDPEIQFKHEYTPYLDQLPNLCLANNTAMTKQSVLAKGSPVTPNTWLHCGWIVPSVDSWVNVDISDGKGTATINMYMDKGRTPSNIDTSKNKNDSDLWSIGVGVAETIKVLGSTLTAYPLFIQPVQTKISYTVNVINHNTTWISAFNGKSGKVFNQLFVVNHV